DVHFFYGHGGMLTSIRRNACIVTSLLLVGHCQFKFWMDFRPPEMLSPNHVETSGLPGTLQLCRWGLALLQKPNLDQQVDRLRRRTLELPVTVLKGSVFPKIGAARIKNVTFAQNTIDEPGLFQLKNLLGESPAFIPGHRHFKSLLGANSCRFYLSGNRCCIGEENTIYYLERPGVAVP